MFWKYSLISNINPDAELKCTKLLSSHHPMFLFCFLYIFMFSKPIFLNEFPVNPGIIFSIFGNI